MTRFEMELNGELGEYWRKDALKRIDKATKDIANGVMLLDENGVATWASNGRCIMDDMAEVVEFTVYCGEFSRERTAIERDKQITKSIAEYKANQKPYTEEELFEMRAAFGVGTQVVDVLSGRMITL